MLLLINNSVHLKIITDNSILYNSILRKLPKNREREHTYHPE